MKRWTSEYKALIIVGGLASAILIGALLIVTYAPTPKVHLIPAATIYRAAPTGGGPTWGGSTWVPSPFRRAQLHHPWCGRRISPQRRGIHGIYRMWFAHCAMAFGPIKVYARATPRPPYRPPPPTLRPLPTNPAPAATPLPTSVHPTSIPTRLPPAPIPTATVMSGGASNDSAAYELSLINATRAQHGLFAYTENTTQSNGAGSCVGSIGHSHDMAASGTIWHVNPAYPSASFPNNLCLQYSAAGENVGEASGSVTQALDTIHGLMLQEPYTPGCSGNHVCSILSSVYRQVGIGIVTTSSGTFLTVDFLS